MSKDTVRALDISYPILEDGSSDYSSPSVYVVSWEEWIALPIRHGDEFVRTSKLNIRIPTVVVCTQYGKFPIKRAKLTNRNIYNRDGGICQYSGKQLSYKESSLDHIIPSSKGGKTEWTNVVLCDKKINNQKGNKSNEEMGLTLLRKPKCPLPVPATAQINRNEIYSKDWELFIFK